MNPHKLRIFGILLISFAFMTTFSSFSADNKLSIVDYELSPDKWLFSNGPEFPGAKGGIKSFDNGKNKGTELFYNLKNGAYVSMSYSIPLLSNITDIVFDVEPSSDCKINYRIINPDGKTFQGQEQEIHSSLVQTVSFSLSGPWSGTWGGENNENIAELFNLSIIITKVDNNTSVGSVKFSNMRVRHSSENNIKLHYPKVNLNLSNWHIYGKWIESWPASKLLLTAKPLFKTDQTGWLEIKLARNGRDSVSRFELLPKQQVQTFVYEFPPYMRFSSYGAYKLKFNVSSGDTSSQESLIISGAKASNVILGNYKNSNNITNLPFGTCVHFSFGRSSSFSVWKNYKRILNEISSCGFKWIRDGVTCKKSLDGTYKVDKYDMQWIKYAKELGISIILVIDMSSRENISEANQRAVAIVNQTKDMIDVYELGNEPNNFGGWIDKYGGTWNGKSDKNATSKWVLEHLKATNSMAQAIKRKNPNVNLIGTGACSPTNFRYIDHGLSSLISGIVDHPYPCSRPPEKVPYGLSVAQRDGVSVGDSAHTFLGLIDSYENKIQSSDIKRYLWLTEFGYSTYWNSPKTSKSDLRIGVSEEAQAVYLVRRFILGLTNSSIKVACQYDFIDDYNSMENNSEANFGILRHDYSKKKAFYAIQRINNILDNCVIDKKIEPSVTKAALHYTAIRHSNIKEDKSVTNACSLNGISSYCFESSNNPNMRIIALWSNLPYGGDYNNRIVSLKLSGASKFNKAAILIRIISGETCDIPVVSNGKSIFLENISLTNDPVFIVLLK